MHKAAKNRNMLGCSDSESALKNLLDIQLEFETRGQEGSPHIRYTRVTDFA